MEEEIWKDIPGFEGLYQVNQWGDIFSFYSHKKLKYSLSHDGYKQYNLLKNKKKKIMMAHKAVALAFIPNLKNYPAVNHKDENKLNCYVDNLEWCTIGYNNRYSNNGKRSGEKTGKKVYCYNLDGALYKIYSSTKEAARDLNVNSSNISTAAQWKEFSSEKKNIVSIKNKIFSFVERTSEEVVSRYEKLKNRKINNKNNKLSKRVQQLTLDDKEKNYYPSVGEASRITGIPARQIARAAQYFNNGATCHGYKWKYI